MRVRSLHGRIPVARTLAYMHVLYSVTVLLYRIVYELLVCTISKWYTASCLYAIERLRHAKLPYVEVPLALTNHNTLTYSITTHLLSTQMPCTSACGDVGKKWSNMAWPWGLVWGERNDAGYRQPSFSHHLPLLLYRLSWVLPLYSMGFVP